MNKTLSQLLIEEINNSISNNFSDNFDTLRFGKRKSDSLKRILLRRLSSKIIGKGDTLKILNLTIRLLSKYSNRLEELYELIADETSKQLLIKLLAYYILGYRKVKLPANNPEYWSQQKKGQILKDSVDSIVIERYNKILYRFNLETINIPISLYAGGIYNQFIAEQYKYKQIVEAQQGDLVIDAGGCWGDTALYFANKVGSQGKVFSFEFIKDNIEIFRQNMNLNKNLSKIIELIENPLWEKDQIDVFFNNSGPASIVKFEAFDGYTGIKKTTSIDSFMRNNNISKVDLIKMDIEGAELSALKGAEETIKEFKPKLAIASYHSLDDFVNIPLWIDNLGLGYKIYLGHTTIHWEETIVFAKVNS